MQGGSSNNAAQNPDVPPPLPQGRRSDPQSTPPTDLWPRPRAPAHPRPDHGKSRMPTHAQRSRECRPAQVRRAVSKLRRSVSNRKPGLKTQSAVSKLNLRSQNSGAPSQNSICGLKTQPAVSKPPRYIKTIIARLVSKLPPPLGLKTPSPVSELVPPASASARFGPRRGPCVRSDFAIARSRAERLSFEPRQRRKRSGENVPNVKSAPRG